MLRRQLGWTAVIAVTFAFASCKKEVPVEVADPLESAIELAGGIKKLKAASAFTARYEAAGPGVKLKGKLQQKNGVMRVEYVIPYGDLVVQAAGNGLCWRKRGQVVIPCDNATRDHTSRLGKLLEASWLWPLREGKDLTSKSAKVTHDGKSYDGLTVSSGGQVVGTLLIDETSSLVVGLKMQTSLGGKSGELVGTFTGFEKACGIKIATKREYSFLGQKILVEKIGGVICEPLEGKHFQRPTQVAHGLVKLKHKGNSSLVCTRLKGPLSGVKGALGEVNQFLAKLALPPKGAPYLIHKAGPPRKPAGYLTQVCLPVGKKSWTLPKSTWKGKFSLEEDSGDEVLAGFGVGDLEKTTPEVAKLLAKGAKERKRKQQKVPLVQILYTHTDEIPADQRVSEMHTVLE